MWRDALAFTAMGAAALALVYTAGAAIEPVYPELGRQMAFLREGRDSIQAVTVGSSHSRAVDFAALGIGGAHLWRGRGDAFEAAYLARDAARRLPGLRYVLVAVSYPTLRVDNAVPGRHDLTVRRREMYAHTGRLAWIRGDGAHFLAGKLSPVVRADHWESVVGRLRHGPPVRPPVGRDGRPASGPHPVLSPDSLARLAASRAADHAEVAREGLRQGRDPRARVAAELDHLALSLAGRGIELVLYTPPYFHAYGEAFDADLLAELRAVMQTLDDRHGNAVWLDYSTDPEFARRAEYYLDSDRLNPDGARAFSARLRACLQALPLRPPACGRPRA